MRFISEIKSSITYPFEEIMHIALKYLPKLLNTIIRRNFMTKSIITSILFIVLFTQTLSAGSVKKVNEQYGDLGLYETYTLQGKHEKCNIVILHGNKIVDTSCLKLANSKKKNILCTKRKSICKTDKELFYFSENGHLPKAKKKKTSNKNSYLNKFKKECKISGVPFCYIVKRYKVFDKACKAGDKLSCKHIKDLEVSYKKGIEEGDASYIQSLHYISNNAQTSRGK